MKVLLKIRNRIRDAVREYDEIVTPVLRFIWCFVCFYSINKMYGYSEFFGQMPVIFLLSVIFAIFNEKFMFFVVGIMLTMNVYEVSLEAAAMFLVIYIAMYCMYIRFFPEYGYVILLSAICCMCGVEFLIPLVVGLIAGLGGIIPAAFGLLIYYFSLSLKEIDVMNHSLTAPEGTETFKYLVENVLKNKEMLCLAIVFAVGIIVVFVIRKLSFSYSAYVSILAGALATIFAYIIVTGSLKIEDDMPGVLLGTFIGLLLAAVIQVFRGILDYKHTENVQFEDDEYYYYVKAVPKIDPEKKKHAPKRRPKRPPMPGGPGSGRRPRPKKGGPRPKRPNGAPDGKRPENAPDAEIKEASNIETSNVETPNIETPNIETPENK